MRRKLLAVVLAMGMAMQSVMPSMAEDTEFVLTEETDSALVEGLDDFQLEAYVQGDGAGTETWGTDVQVVGEGAETSETDAPELPLSGSPHMQGEIVMESSGVDQDAEETQDALPVFDGAEEIFLEESRFVEEGQSAYFCYWPQEDGEYLLTGENGADVDCSIELYRWAQEEGQGGLQEISRAQEGAGYLKAELSAAEAYIYRVENHGLRQNIFGVDGLEPGNTENDDLHENVLGVDGLEPGNAENGGLREDVLGMNSLGQDSGLQKNASDAGGLSGEVGTDADARLEVRLVRTQAVQSVSLAYPPARTRFAVGEPIAPDGMAVTLVYADGSEQEVAVGETDRFCNEVEAALYESTQDGNPNLAEKRAWEAPVEAGTYSLAAEVTERAEIYRAMVEITVADIGTAEETEQTDGVVEETEAEAPTEEPETDAPVGESETDDPAEKSETDATMESAQKEREMTDLQKEEPGEVETEEPGEVETAEPQTSKEEEAQNAVEEKVEAIASTAEIEVNPTSGTCGKNGDNIVWNYDTETKTLTISGEGEMADYAYDTFGRYDPSHPWILWKDEICTVSVVGTIENIDAYALHDCDSLTSVDLPDGLTSIGDYAFSDCSSLMSVDLPDGLTSIGSWAFQNCGSLMSVDLPDGLTSIGVGAFGGCNSLASVDFPEGLTSIAGWAFRSCDSLKFVYFTGDMPELYYESFKYCTLYAYYPSDNLTYHPDKLQHYGGTITWVPYGSGMDHFAYTGGESSIYTIWEWISWKKNIKNTMNYLANSENFLHALYMESWDGGVVGRFDYLFENFIDVGDGWRELFFETTSKENAEKILCAILSEGSDEIKVLAEAKSVKSLASMLSSIFGQYLAASGYDYYKASEIRKKFTASEFEEALKDNDLAESIYKKAVEIIGNPDPELEGLIRIFLKSNSVENCMEKMGWLIDGLDVGQVAWKEWMQYKTLQESNALYREMLTYIGENAEYQVLQDAAKNLLQRADTKITQELARIAEEIAATKGADYALDKALENVWFLKAAKDGMDWGKDLSDWIMHTQETNDLRNVMRVAAGLGDCLSHWVKQKYLELDYEEIDREKAETLLYALEYLAMVRRDGERSMKELAPITKDERAERTAAGTISELESTLKYIHLIRQNELQRMEAACPVDVDVLDASGNVVLTVLDGQEYSGEQDGISFYTYHSAINDDFMKVILVPKGAGYTFRLRGTDYGKVSCKISEIGEDGTVVEAAVEQVAVDAGTQIAIDPADDIRKTTYIKERAGQEEPETGTFHESTVTQSIAVEGLTTEDPLELELELGEKKVLSCHVTPKNASNQKIIWTSSDEAVATVNFEGTVTILKYGAAIVTATSADGGFTLQYNVSVKHEHQWSEWEITKPATAQEEGEQRRTCTLCGKEETERIEKLKEEPTPEPSEEPKEDPSEKPSEEPTETPTPSAVPSETPAGTPTPSVAPTATPSENPKERPTETPSEKPSATPTPSVTPPKNPEEKPTETPTVTLNAKSTPLQVGKTSKALKVVKLEKGDKVVSWSSSNKKVVTVSAKGVLKAKKKTGKAVITVRTKLGATASCTITVQKKKVKLKSLSVSVTGVSIKKGKATLRKGEKRALEVKRSPITATESITYSSSNKKVASVSAKGVIQAKKKGKCKITVKSSNGKKKVITITVK